MRAIVPAGLLPDEGLANQLQYILSDPISGVINWKLLLFVNDIVPDFGTVLADLTEATWTGYSSVILDRSTWTTPTVSAGCATSTYGTTAIIFDVGMGPVQTNFGCAYVDPSMSVLRFVQRFDDADIAPIVVGGQFQILPQYTLTSAACGSAMLRAIAKFRRAKGER
jgi:hypothetical protein